MLTRTCMPRSHCPSATRVSEDAPQEGLSILREVTQVVSLWTQGELAMRLASPVVTLSDILDCSWS